MDAIIYLDNIRKLLMGKQELQVLKGISPSIQKTNMPNEPFRLGKALMNTWDVLIPLRVVIIT